MAGGLIAGVDLNFDVATTQDYTTGSEQDRTDFNIGLSKRLLNDRLTVTVGTDIQLEGPSPANGQNNSSPDVTVDYRLSKDGRYMLRAYRRNEYDIEGYIIETGLSFILSVDYNTFKQIFQRNKAPKNRKKKSPAKTTTGNQAIAEDKQPLTTPAKENK